MKKLRIIIGGFIGLYPTGGVTWDYIQYVLGFQLLGHDVYYIEDTHQFSRYQSEGQRWDDPANTIIYLQQTMRKFGLNDRWAYKNIGTGYWYGLNANKVKEVLATADLFINVSAANYHAEEYLKIPCTVLVDSDPMFTQVQYWKDDDPAKSVMDISAYFNNYKHIFSFGENLGAPDCKVPLLNLEWKTTRQPICLDHWTNTKPHTDHGFTTVMNWSVREKLKYNNEEWGQKDVEFKNIMNIPSRVSDVKFSVVMASSLQSSPQISATLASAGWTVLDPLVTVNSPDDYRQFIQSSKAEFSVAKETYVKANTGWFSCRSACYLAAGRPVVTQETGWSKYIPSGLGVIGFSDEDSGKEAVEEIICNYHKHSRASQEVAREYFDSKIILTKLLEATA